MIFYPRKLISIEEKKKLRQNLHILEPHIKFN